MQTVGDNLNIAGGQVGDAVSIVLQEFLYHLLLCLLMVFVVGLILAQGTVALLTDDTLRLVDGKVEGGREVSVFPGLALLYMEVAATVVRHGPYGDGNSDDNE